MKSHRDAAAIIARAREVLSELAPEAISGYQFFREEDLTSIDDLLAKIDRWRRYHEDQADELGEDDETPTDVPVESARILVRPKKWERIAKRVADPSTLDVARRPKRFVLFVDDSTTNGGWEEIKGWFDTLDDAVEFARDYVVDNDYWWWHVVDVQTFDVVADYLPTEAVDPWWGDPRDLTT